MGCLDTTVWIHLDMNMEILLAKAQGILDLLNWDWYRQLTVADAMAGTKCRFKLVRQSIHGIDALYVCRANRNAIGALYFGR